MAAGRKKGSSCCQPLCSAANGSLDGMPTKKTSSAGDHHVVKSSPCSTWMPRWKSRPCAPKTTPTSSENGARMKPDSKATAAHAARVESRGRRIRKHCSARTGAHAGRDHIESKMYICSVVPLPQKRPKRAPHSSLHMPDEK